MTAPLRSRWKTFVVSAGLAVVLLWIGFRSAEAFEVRPAIFDLAVPIGSSTERELTVRNTNGKPLELTFSVQKFLPGGEGRPRFLDPADRDGLPEWMDVTPSGLRLAPGEERTVRLRIAVPATAEPGGNYAAVFATERIASPGPGTIGRRIASLVLLAVTGERSGPQIRPVGTLQRLEGDEVRVAIALKNTGNAHGIAETRLVARRWRLFGPQEKAFVQAVRLLPGEERTVAFAWSEPGAFLRLKTSVFVDGVEVPSLARTMGAIRPLGWLAIVGTFVTVCVLAYAARWVRFRWKRVPRNLFRTKM